MAEIDMMVRYPKSQRPILERSQASADDRRLSLTFGREYFDGTRQQGYGGYVYNGWFKPVVAHFIEHYRLAPDAHVLDVGCAKGFMLHDFKAALPHCTVAGLDISGYAIGQGMPSVRPFLTIGSCDQLPYADRSFDLVVSIATIHNLEVEGVKRALREIQRVSRGNSFIKVNGYRNDAERVALHQWNVVAKTILHVDEWKRLFAEVGYTGDYTWFTP
jgi:SAM-dependent methyltransferase